ASSPPGSKRTDQERSMSKLFLRAAIAAAAFACLFASPCALAQEAPNSPAATQPAAGHATVRQQLRYIRYGDDPTAADRRAEDIVWWHAVSVGLTGELSLSFEAPLIYREVDAPAPEDDGSHF